MASPSTTPLSPHTSWYASPWRSRLGGMTVIIIAVIMAILDGARLTKLWPCEIACQGGAHYQTIAGISVIWFALFGHALLIGLSWHDVKRGGWCPWSIRLVWFLGGISLFFTWIAWQLELVCVYCITIHAATATIVCLCYPFPRTVRWWQACSWLLVGLLSTNAIFHHTVVADVVTHPATHVDKPPTTTPAGLTQQLAMNQGRIYGNANAPRTLEIIIDLTCRHCAEEYEPLIKAINPHITSGQVRVVVHHLVRPSQAAALPATELVFAAAALDQHAIALDILLGTSPDATAAGLTARLAEVIDTNKLSPLLTTYKSDISAVIAEDQKRIQQLGLGPRTPSAALTEDDRITFRWSGSLPIAGIIMAVNQPL